MSYRYRPTVVIGGKQYLLSRVTMGRHLGRPLNSDEIVHHKDHDPTNNAIENLELVSRGEHRRRHPEIGVSTRLTKKWHLDPAEVIDAFKTKSTRQIAREIGCSYKTVARFIKAFTGSTVDMRSLQFLRGDAKVALLLQPRSSEESA